MVLSIRVLKNVQTKIYIMKTGGDGNAGRNPEQQHFGHGYSRNVGTEKDQKHRQKLRNRGPFTHQAWFDFNMNVGQSKNNNTGDNQNIAADYNDCQPGRNYFENRQACISRGQQQFVGNGIKVGAQYTVLIEISRKEAVQSVADGRDGEHDECRMEQIF